MLKRINLLSFLFIISCAQVGQSNKTLPQFRQDVKPLANLNVVNVEVFNGKLKFLNIPLDLADGTHKIQCKKSDDTQTISMLVKDSMAYIYYVEDYYSTVSSRECFLKDGRKILNVSIKQFPYQQEKLRVAKKKVVLSKKNQKRVEREWLLTQEIYKNSTPYFLFSRPFQKPLNSKITSDFGKRRVFNDLKKTSHLGTDFRAAVGVPIPVANQGKVVFTGNLFYTGNVVIVDHGVDIFSLYAHLSKIQVKQGQMLQQGDIVGLAGRTGRVSGPHLHWGVKIAGKAVDGFSLIEASQEHFVQ